jgi:hypothetical protein
LFPVKNLALVCVLLLPFAQQPIRQSHLISSLLLCSQP